jgi:hypothetical protein
MDWQQWQAELEAAIARLTDLETTSSVDGNRLLSAADIALIHRLEEEIGQSLPADFIEFYEHFGGLRLPDIWNSYFIMPVEHLLQFPTPRQLHSPEYNGRILIFGSDAGGQYFCIFFGVENQPVLYLPDALWEDIICSYSVIGGRYLSPKWLAPDFSGFLQRVLEDTRAYVRNDPDWEYMDHGLYDQRNL